ncbi:MAG: ABC transporter ATP-binding protein [Clostridiales bacterium]|jgi:ABC-2 type transport system ATP-binding protein|nr:ABC transporter ATP-binding protein [Clostridiales bacterium]
MSRNVMIKTKELTKKYEDLTAVDNLNLEIYEGEIFGLLGPNGAGKTTTILMLLGLTEPTSGFATIDGHNTTKEPIYIKRMVGYLPDNVGFYEDMTARENLRFTGRLNGLSEEEIESRIDSLLERVKLSDVGDKRVGTYSKGMKQRLGIADTLMKDPKVIILDEPTIGLDPAGINEMLNLIADLAREDKRTVLISSHQLYQIQKICDRVGIFVKGHLIAEGPIHTLGEQVFKGKPLTLELNIEPVDDKLVSLIKSIREDIKIKIVDHEQIIIESIDDIRKPLLRLLSDNDYKVLFLKQTGRDLDDIYSRYFAREE